MPRRRKGQERGARIATGIAAAFLLATFAPPVDAPPDARPADTVMRAEPVPLDEADPARRRLGGLVFLEGWRLSSRDLRFGGLSAMHVEGGVVLGLSDAGALFRFPLPRGSGEMPLNIVRVPSGPGSGRSKSDRDGEALQVAGGSAWIAWEGRNAIWRYRRRDFAAEAKALPREMRRWRWMSGPEAMARLADGRFIILAEGPAAADGTAPALLFHGDPAVAGTRITQLRHRPPPFYRATDAAQLPDGRLLVLNRRFAPLSGFSAVLTVADLRGLRPGATIAPRVLAEFKGSVTADNLEALSVTREGGRSIVWLASDDNFNPLLQRTLLLKFALAE